MPINIVLSKTKILTGLSEYRNYIQKEATEEMAEKKVLTKDLI